MHTSLPNTGDYVWIRQRRWRVERIRRQADVARYDVVTRDRRASFLAPFDRPVWRADAARLRYAPPRQAQARLADVLGRTFSHRSLASVIDADAAILPHQLEPGLAIVNGARRVLIADAVGLGKTIQAGIIVAEIVRRVPAARVLVIVPASLADQWHDELRRRFRITSLQADRAELDARSRAAAFGDNPWTRSGTWIASLDYLKQPHVLDALPRTAWDLVVVDEAHTACGDSDRHDACRTVTRTARRVVLLTATPHDGDAARFARLIGLGALPELNDPLTIFRRTRHDLRARIARRARWQRVKVSAEESDLFAALGTYEQSVLRSAGALRRDAALLLLAVLRKRGLSTMSALETSLRRRLAWLEQEAHDDSAEPIQRALVFDDADDLAPDEAEGLSADVGMDPRRERAWIRRLLVLAEAAGKRESKAARVVAFARRLRESLIVFTEFRDSLEVLRRRFGSASSLACLHGGQTIAERRNELARFLDGHASVVIATDVASLGLNLQTRARAIVNLELPWNPVRLEQRAGRVDRIGQTRPVHVTMVVARHDAEAPVLIRLATRALAAREAVGGAAQDESLVGEAAIREHVLAGAGIKTTVAGPTPPWRPSQRWIRPARAAARCLARQRALRGRWRAPDEDGRGSRWTIAKRLTIASAAPHSATLIFSVPIVDGAGTIVESHAVGVRIPVDGCGHPCWPALLESAGGIAAQAVAPRARRLSRRLRGQLDLDIDRERIIGAHLSGQGVDAETQPGLFDQRERRAFAANRQAEAAVHGDVDHRVVDLQRSCAVDVGQPWLVLAAVKRP